jgi:hypothetical protein
VSLNEDPTCEMDVFKSCAHSGEGEGSRLASVIFSENNENKRKRKKRNVI